MMQGAEYSFDTSFVGVIMAGGHGTRLKATTKTEDKALLPVAGRPLISWILEDMRRAGLGRIGVVCRPEQSVLARWLRGYAQTHGLEVSIIERTVQGTLAAVEAGMTWAEGPAVLSTCDVAAPVGTVGLLRQAAATLPSEPLALLAATQLQDPTQPVWLDVAEDGVVRNVGKDISPTRLCFGHVRLLGSQFLPALREYRGSLVRDTELLGVLAQKLPGQVRAVLCGPISDVDQMADVPLAEHCLSAEQHGPSQRQMDI
jgi:NDP-sugar pyrophosphorylase family protein